MCGTRSWTSFLASWCDEEHAILISSHIITDLEKVADYITYLHQGRWPSRLQGRDLEHYGRVACTAAQLASIRPEHLLRVRRGQFGCEALVADRKEFRRLYPDLPVDRLSLEEIMLLIGRGENP